MASPMELYTLPVFLYTPATTTTCTYVLDVCMHKCAHMSAYDCLAQSNFVVCRTKGCCLATMLFCTGILLNL